MSDRSAPKCGPGAQRRSRPAITITLRPSTLRRVDALARSQDTPRSRLVERALCEFLRRDGEVPQ